MTRGLYAFIIAHPLNKAPYSLRTFYTCFLVVYYPGNKGWKITHPKLKAPIMISSLSFTFVPLTCENDKNVSYIFMSFLLFSGFMASVNCLHFREIWAPESYIYIYCCFAVWVLSVFRCITFCKQTGTPCSLKHWSFVPFLASPTETTPLE